MLACQDNSLSWYSTNIFATTGPSGKSMAAPSISLNIVLLKLNFTDVVAAVSNSTNVL